MIVENFGHLAKILAQTLLDQYPIFMFVFSFTDYFFHFKISFCIPLSES